MKARTAIFSITLAATSIAMISTGCDKACDECCFVNQMVNPWQDDVEGSDSVTTPSVQGVRDSGKEPTHRSARFAEATFEPPSGAVAHWPLWWEDPFVDKGDGDDTFAVTWADYLGMPYGLGRFILNTMGWPVSATVQPVWLVMESDGVLSEQALGYDHDATPMVCTPEAVEEEQGESDHEHDHDHDA